MFGLVRKKNPYEQPARELYASALEQTRVTYFYEDLGVPDTLDGRFDLLVLHSFIIIHCLRTREKESAEGLAQGVFDIVFADMDQGLRESGIGDMGVPKHMRRMMKGFNGRMHAYEEALEANSAKELHEVLSRNLYGTLEKPDIKAVKVMADYISKNISCINKQSYDALLSGKVEFCEIKRK